MITRAHDGGLSDGNSDAPAVSADGRFVAFRSEASNLVPDDTNGAQDVFVYDRLTGATERVSVASDGTQANGPSADPRRRVSISADGRLVAFDSDATNLIPDDTNDRTDVFIRDRQTGETTRVSTRPNGGQLENGGFASALSADGTFVAYVTTTVFDLLPRTPICGLVLRELESGKTVCVSLEPGDDASGERGRNAAISADGRFVAFVSDSDTLVPADANDVGDVFVFDRESGEIARVSVAGDGAEANDDSGFLGLAISADGRFIAFASNASNLVPDDTNDSSDLFMYERAGGAIARVNVSADGVETARGFNARPELSADGRFVAFSGLSSGLLPPERRRCGTLVKDRVSGEILCASVGDDGEDIPAGSQLAMDAGGRVVAFVGRGSLMRRDTGEVNDLYVREAAP